MVFLHSQGVGAARAVRICKTPLVAGQRVKGDKHPYDFIVVANTEAAETPIAAKPIPIPD